MPSKRYFQTTDIELLVPMILIGFLAALFSPPLPSVHGIKGGGILLAIGFLFFLAAKVSLFRRDIWTSWGPKQMTLCWARLYKTGYALMGIGVLIVMAAYRALH